MWDVELRRGTAGNLHAQSADLAARGAEGRSVLILEAIRPAVVLGSSQPAAHLDLALALRSGVEVARRRSGGGAVWVGPGSVVWIDVFIPLGDALWDADVGRAAWWVGDAWAAALQSTGLLEARVWRGPMERRLWSERVCFAGLGPGEVTVGSSKVVGISQRRTRAGALFQTAALLRWEPDRLIDLLQLGEDSRSGCRQELRRAGLGVGAKLAGELAERFVASLPN